MKAFTLILALCSFGLLSCSPYAGTGSIDLGSLSEDASFHEQTESTDSTGTHFRYAYIELKSDQTFTQKEASFDSAGSGKKCEIVGTWTLQQGDATAGTGNRLVVTASTLNGGALSKTFTYEITELTSMTLKLKLDSSASDVDLTNTDFVTYSEYQSASALTDDSFCNR